MTAVPRQMVVTKSYRASQSWLDLEHPKVIEERLVKAGIRCLIEHNSFFSRNQEGSTTSRYLTLLRALDQTD
jgi:hypothetical protein